VNVPTRPCSAATPGSAHGPPLQPLSSTDDALAELTAIVSELIRLSVEDKISSAQLEALRTRRHQLSAIIDSVARFGRPPPAPSRRLRTPKNPAIDGRSAPFTTQQSQTDPR
jgi:hypothetical protein